jgi:hypothetical protein
MSNNITIGNLITIGDMKFHDIEGGFGKDKRAMLVKEIAEIHGKEIKYINKQINANRKHFTDGKDILDLAGTEFAVHLMNSGIYTQNAINASTNIYVLSERGYSKLLKIMDDDLAWEKYDALVDGYFQMRKEAKESSHPKLGEVNAAARIISKTLKEAGMPPQYRAVAIKSLYAPVGVKIPLDGVTTDKRLFDCTAIAKKFGMLSSSGKPHYQAVAAIIAKLPVSESEKELVPFQNQASGHAGPTWQYAQSVVDKVEKWLEEHDWPTSITAGGKTYKVTYQQAV